MKVAAIGIGSNSLRMLVADVLEGKLHNPIRYREGLRVFAALDERGNISPEMIDKACQSVLNFKLQAAAKGAEEIHLFATSATRDAANQEQFIRALEESTKLKLDVCSGDKEATLSFWGGAENGPTGLIDIGGGSTEIAVGCGKTVNDAVSLQMGAVRLYRMRAISSVQEAMEVTSIASQILEPVRERFVSICDELTWVGVGGTFTTSAALIQRIPWQERGSIHGFSISRQSLMDAICYLAPMPMEERLKLDCLQPHRADIVVHGMCILLACMQAMNIPSIMVSEHGNLEGYLKEKYIFDYVD
ncbi:MAG: hypothetical protein IKU70_08830 [Clostridia bacterium]|nr:hypothetical protein [Clostridia bacterium]